MAAMKRERQWDMFDVATGQCPLDDYLNQRYSENDLSSKFWVEPSDRVDELRPPPKGSKVQVVIPVQGPGVGPPKPIAAAPALADQPLPSRPPWEAAPAEAPLPSRPPWESAAAATPAPASTPAPRAHSTFTPPTPPQAPPREAAPYVPTPPPQHAAPSPQVPPSEAEPAPAPGARSMAELLAQFHQAAKAYEERAKDEDEEA